MKNEALLGEKFDRALAESRINDAASMLYTYSNELKEKFLLEVFDAALFYDQKLLAQEIMCFPELKDYYSQLMEAVNYAFP